MDNMLDIGIPWMQTEESVSKQRMDDPASRELLILCAIDGVLIEAEPEAHIAAHLDALRDSFGVDVHREQFWAAAQHGMTDRRIAQQLLIHAGFPAHTVSGEQIEAWRARISELFERYTTIGGIMPELLPHVRKGLQSVASTESALIIPATGNIEKIALAKMQATEIDCFFPESQGGFGDYHLERPYLLQEAMLRAGWLGVEETKAAERVLKRTFVIGDTIRDMEAAVNVGARPIGITTGALGKSELFGAGAEQVFMRFDRAIEWILDQQFRLRTAVAD